MPRRPIPRSTAASITSVPAAVGADLTTLSETGVAPRTRLKDANAAHRLFNSLLKADFKSQANRTILQQCADGAPPQPDSALVAQGMAFVYNLNFLEMDSRLAAALVSYDDLADSSEHLIVPETVPKSLPPEDLVEACDIVAEEHATLIREQSDFYPKWQRLGKEFVSHGVSFAYFPDEETPWWDVAGWDQCLIPRKTEAKESAISIFITRKPYGVHELYKFIEDQNYAAKWNVPEVQKAIVAAARGNDKAKQWSRYWAEIEQELKNNDLGFGLGDAEQVHCLHYWIREFDGSYTFAIGLENGNNADFLYKDEKRYNHANQAFVAFTLGVGNGTYHSIRGALWKMFPFIQTSNRFQNKMLTNTDIAMTLLLQGEEGDSYDDLQLTLGPAIGTLPAGAKIVDRKLPDVGTQGMPIVQHLGDALEKATAQFQSPSPMSGSAAADSGNTTKYALQSLQQHHGALTSNSVNLFYRSVDKKVAEQWRRIVAIGPTGKVISEKDGTCRYPEVKEFFDRCIERMEGMDMTRAQAIKFITKDIRKVKAMRAIGNGSPQLRLLALDELQQMAGSLDETGRDLATRDRIALRFGRQSADRYKPKVKRIAPDVQIAGIENVALANGDIQVYPDQNHAIHAGIHVPFFQQTVGEIVAYREQDPEADFSPMEPKLQHALRLHSHASLHVQAMAADASRAADMKSYRAALETGGNLLMGFARELQQQERHAQQNAGQPQQPGGDDRARQDEISASVPKAALEIQKQQEELQQKRETHAVSMQLASAKVAQVAQTMRLEAVKTDALIAQGVRARQGSTPDTKAA